MYKKIKHETRFTTKHHLPFKYAKWASRNNILFHIQIDKTNLPIWGSELNIINYIFNMSLRQYLRLSDDKKSELMDKHHIMRCPICGKLSEMYITDTRYGKRCSGCAADIEIAESDPYYDLAYEYYHISKEVSRG